MSNYYTTERKPLKQYTKVLYWFGHPFAVASETAIGHQTNLGITRISG